MKKVLFVATVVKTHIMEFHIPYLKMFKEMGWETAVAAKNDYENHADCVIPYCDSYYNIPFERNPLKIGNLKAYKNLKNIIDEGKYDIIHCHTPVGAMLTRIAAKQARKKGTKVFYTAHGFHFYKGAPIMNWLLYYPVEKWLSRYTDVLITINKEDYERAKTFKAGKVYYVPGVGIDLKKFNVGYVDREEKRKEIGVQSDSFVLLSVGELIPRKNHEVVIRAISFLKKLGKDCGIEYVICGSGRDEDRLKSIADNLKVRENVHFLGYRKDISAICKCCDLFVFMSYQEGLPVALMESMACGLPVVCSNIRGNTDLIKDDLSGIIAQSDEKSVAEAIVKMKEDERLRNRLSKVALEKIKEFDLENVKMKMEEIYSCVDNKRVALLMQSVANGGVQRVMINLAKGMVKKGIDVDFLLGSYEGEMKDMIPNECLIYDFKKKKSHGDSKVFLAIPQIAQYLKKNQKITIFASPGLSCTVMAFLKIFYRDIKVILINDNRCSLLKQGNLYHKVVYYINKFLYNFADYIVAAHTKAKEDIKNNYHIIENKLKVIYHPLIDMDIINDISPEKMHPFIKARQEGYKVLLAAGRLVPEKAFDNLIDAVAIVRKKYRIKLIILGEGNQREDLQKRIIKKNMEEDIDLFGYTDCIYSYMKSADLYVLSSRQEAFGNVLIEAISCGLPCVATNCDSGGPLEIMEKEGEGTYGVLCEKEHIEELAKAIEIALKKQYDFQKFKDKAEYYTISYSSEKYIELLRD